MRRTALTSLALAAALALAGCGGSGNGGETTAPAGGDGQTTAPAGGETADPGAGGVVGMPTVTGAFGEQPVLEFPAEPPADLQVETLHEGDGAEVPEGSFIVADYIGQVWGADAPFNDTWMSGGAIGFSLDRVIDGWSEGIPGANVGDRLLISIPSEKGYPEGNPGINLEPGDTIVFVIDVLGSFPADEMFGEADARETGELANLPMSVEGALGAQPTLSIDPDAPEPTEVVGTVVAEGSGEPVGETGLVVAAYHLATWDGVDGGNTWAQGYPEAVPLGQGTPLDALIGAPVGSRVVIQVPASGTSPAIGTVVEVLGYIPPRDAAVGGPGANSLN